MLGGWEMWVVAKCQSRGGRGWRTSKGDGSHWPCLPLGSTPLPELTMPCWDMCSLHQLLPAMITPPPSPFCARAHAQNAACPIVPHYLCAARCRKEWHLDSKAA